MTTDCEVAADPLFEMELRIARRADGFVSERGCSGALNRECWLQAEAEVLAQWPEPQATRTVLGAGP